MTVRRLEDIAAVIGALTLLWTAVALAKTTPAEKCEAAKLSAAEKYGACRLGAEKTAVLKAIAPDYSKCDAQPVVSSQRGCPVFRHDCDAARAQHVCNAPLEEAVPNLI